MKINKKLILIDLFFALALSLSVLLPISQYNGYIKYEDLRIEMIGLQENSERVRFSIFDILSKNEVSDSLLSPYLLNTNFLSSKLDVMTSFPKLYSLSQDIEDDVEVLLNEWDSVQSIIDADAIRSYLSIREQYPASRPQSLISLQTLLLESSDASYSFRTRVDDAVYEISYLENSYNNFSILLEFTIGELVANVDRIQRRRFVFSLVGPFVVLLLAGMVIFLYLGKLSRGLKTLDTALVDIGSGNLSIRVKMTGNDEFTDLASNVNILVSALSSKIESMRIVMGEISQSLSKEIDLASIEEKIVELATKDNAADGAGLYLVNEDDGSAVLSTTTENFRPPYPLENLPESPDHEDIVAMTRAQIINPGRTVVGQVLISGESLMIRDVETEGDLGISREADNPLYLSSITVIPLYKGSSVFAVLVATSSQPGVLFSDFEFINLQSFSELAAIILDNINMYAELLEATQLNRELDIAEEIQENLKPHKMPELQNAHIAYMARTVKGINSDYFDIIPLKGKKLLIAICEVSGRGVPAGLVKVMVRTVLNLIASVDKDAQKTLEELNQNMTQRVTVDNYANVGIIIIDDTGSFSFASAGHKTLQVYRAAQSRFEIIQTKGPQIGLEKLAEYEQKTGQLSADDMTLLISDGVIKSRNAVGEPLGLDNFLEFIGKNASKTPQIIAESLKIYVEQYEKRQTQNYDQTAIIYKQSGAAS